MEREVPGCIYFTIVLYQEYCIKEKLILFPFIFTFLVFNSLKIDSCSDLTKTEFKAEPNTNHMAPLTHPPAKSSGFAYPNLGIVNNVGLYYTSLNLATNMD